MQRIYVDLETTGRDPAKHEIYEIAAIAIEDTVTEVTMVSSIHLTIKCSLLWAERGALEMSKYSQEQIKSFETTQGDAFNKFSAWLCSMRAQNDNKRAVLAGFNVGFDKDFLFVWFKRYSAYLLNHVSPYVIDIYPWAQSLHGLGLINSEKLKLSNVAEFFGVALPDAHTAMADIEASMQIAEKYMIPSLKTSKLLGGT